MMLSGYFRQVKSRYAKSVGASEVKTQEEMLLRNRARSFGVPSRHLGLETLDGQETELELVPGSSEDYRK